MFVIDQLRLVSTITSGIIIIGLLFHWNLDILAWIIIKSVIIGLIIGISINFLFSLVENCLKK